MNDRAVAKRLLATLPLAGDGAQGVGLVLGWQGREAALVEPGIVSDWEGFTESKPFWRAAKGSVVSDGVGPKLRTRGTSRPVIGPGGTTDQSGGIGRAPGRERRFECV